MTITKTDFHFPGQTTGVYKGKVRDVYSLGNDLLLMIATDRISAFDVILPEGIPFKGQVLNQITKLLPGCHRRHRSQLENRRSRSYGHRRTVLRAAARGNDYPRIPRGQRIMARLCRRLSRNLRSKTPRRSTAEPEAPRSDNNTHHQGHAGHDLNISADEIVAQGLMSRSELDIVCDYTRQLFARGTEMAADKGLVLVDTKYEFGMHDGRVTLIDEIHTPDSSRYFYADTYDELFAKDLPQRQLSKEFVREWLMANGFMGQPGQKLPEMTEQVCREISDRYIELHTRVTGREFVPASEEHAEERIATSVLDFLDNVNR